MKYKKIIIFALILIVTQYIYFGFFVKPGVDPNNSITVTVNKGASLEDISQELKDKNIINSKILFLSYIKFKDLDTKIKSGVFRIPLPQNYKSLSEILIKSPLEEKVTIPEGFTAKNIDSLLFEKGLITQGDFLACIQKCEIDNTVLRLIPTQTTRNLEGFLFPDTYFINSQNFTPEELIIKMLYNFENKTSEFANNKDFYNKIIVASIIEKEVISKKDKAIVSGILQKRLSSDWALGADATLLYEKNNNTITTDDLEKVSPYNTRKFKGLPPTPICNPSIDSILASLHPVSSEYWFYLTKPDTKETVFAITNEEHNENKRKWLY